MLRLAVFFVIFCKNIFGNKSTNCSVGAFAGKKMEICNMPYV
jgi:hypothetical protein